jgi:protein TonB
VNPGDIAQAGIAAYIPDPVGTTGAAAAPAAKIERPKKPAPARATERTKSTDDQTADSNGAVGTTGTQQGGAAGGTGPVRLGTGAGLTLLKRVTPTYPRALDLAHMAGSVVLDAVIHRDGTIGDITVLRSSHPSFTQAAIDAVKQWQYTPIPFEGIVTVTVNFTPR